MDWASPVVSQAILTGIIDSHNLRGLSRRVRRRGRRLPSSDSLWVDELLSAGLITPYQAIALLATAECEPAWTVLRSGPLQIGRYVALDRAGRSDLGTTYRCQLPRGRCQLAVKLLDPKWATWESLTSYPETTSHSLGCVAGAELLCAPNKSGENAVQALRSRIAQECQAWAELGDPRIAGVECVELIEPGGELLLVRPWTSGRSLADLLRARRRLTPESSLSLWRQLVNSLAAAEAHGLIHGNISLCNVLVIPNGSVRLTDCGLRRVLLQAGLAESRRLPPEQYECVAPEIAAGRSAPDASSDMYALGCLLYHMTTGCPPFLGGDAAQKCAAHRVARPRDPVRLGVEPGPAIRTILEATIRPHPSGRVSSYNELLSLLIPPVRRTACRLQRELRGTRCTLRTRPSSALGRTSGLWAKWLVLAAAGLLLTLSLVSLPLRVPAAWSLSRSRGGRLAGPVAARSPSTAARRSVDALWNATEQLRRSCQETPSGGTIVLNSPGPFLLDGLEILKPMTIQGAPNVRPLFLGGPGASLRIGCRGVHLQNLHFLRVSEPLSGAGKRNAGAMIELAAAGLSLSDCSFHDLYNPDGRSPAIEWIVPEAGGSLEPAKLEARNILFRGVGCGVAAKGQTPTRLHLTNCLHLGPGPLVVSRSSPGKPMEAVEVRLSRVTVYGAGTVAHSFPHPLDSVRPLHIAADQCALVPHDRNQPLLAVEYAAIPHTLMPLVVWSGKRSICPADSLMIEVTRGSESSAWQTSSSAAWDAYWGEHSTGLLGVRLPFASTQPASMELLPRLQLEDQTPVGADPTPLHYPPPVTFEQLPLLIQRLTGVSVQ